MKFAPSPGRLSAVVVFSVFVMTASLMGAGCGREDEPESPAAIQSEIDPSQNSDDAAPLTRPNLGSSESELWSYLESLSAKAQTGFIADLAERVSIGTATAEEEAVLERWMAFGVSEPDE